METMQRFSFSASSTSSSLTIKTLSSRNSLLNFIGLTLSRKSSNSSLTEEKDFLKYSCLLNISSLSLVGSILSRNFFASSSLISLSIIPLILLYTSLASPLSFIEYPSVV
ncbi:109aa long hypothetical protein [Pyrococcus horikoshii OT3]|uniref:Uncharacterized protein n=1 Tax=Pyrococcus horikoshii (strain ATCC 700860 / DSM 12428 / JCM 9974 / NBRC 100139 / OT-3) TaxID=70601 RepID=O58184_PYRHO|nr:109aa long hypothetical protein [Pyrococcus horikoshii OT3]